MNLTLDLYSLAKKNDRSRCLFFSSGGITLTRVIVNDSCLRYLPSVLDAMCDKSQVDGFRKVAMDIVVVGNAKEDASQVAKAESEGDI